MHLSLMYMRQYLIEDFLPEEIIHELPFIKDSHDFISFTISRPQRVRNLLIHLYKYENDKNVEQFIDKILKNNATLRTLPTDAAEILLSESKLAEKTMSIQVEFEPSSYFYRANLCKKAIDWICNSRFEKEEFIANEPKRKSLLIIYGKSGSGKSLFCEEVFHSEEMINSMPLGGIIKFNFENQLSNEENLGKIYEKLKVNLKVPLFSTSVNQPSSANTNNGNLTKLHEDITSIMESDKAPVDRLILILDQTTAKMNNQFLWEHLTFPNVITIVVTNDMQLVDEFSSEDKFEMPSTFSREEWQEILHLYLQSQQLNEEMNEKLEKIANKVEYLPCDLMKIACLLSNCNLQKRIDYLNSIPVEKIRGYAANYA